MKVFKNVCTVGKLLGRPQQLKYFHFKKKKKYVISVQKQTLKQVTSKVESLGKLLTEVTDFEREL